MPHDHWTVLKDLDVAAVKPRPIKEFLHLFDEAERRSLLLTFKRLGTDEQHYETLFTVVKNGTEAITTPHDGQTLLTEYHRFVLELLEEAGKPVRNLRNYSNKFCKPEGPPKTESSSKTTSSLKWKRSIPSEEQLRHELDNAYVVLLPLARMAWKSPLFDWYVTAYLGHSIQTALAADSVVADDEDHHGGGDGLKPSADGAGGDVDDQDDDEDEEQGGLDPSDYIEAHTSIVSQKPSKLAIAKEWVYWLRLVVAPLHYPFLFFAHPLSRNMPNLSFRTLTYLPSSMDMDPWKEVVKTLYPDPQDHTVIIDDVIKTYGHPASRNMISDPNFSFKGVPHCEAVLACLHYLASSGESVDPVCPPSSFPQTYTDSLTVGGFARRAGPAQKGGSTHRAL
ncbi:hypothetical protein FN846DRAFT_74069 [Sphaerosporella brunnea]|uniref:Uncharacterized protein n=1 Tax=Sphaerosporella brunnea TaxID=1250544 RepID=A0A5J5ETM0_9PEZI|nr:hypothetical protein FN846DRAFT_74069 [Sphaerosporella brunnea]